MAQAHNGFNLIVGDLRTGVLAYGSNRQNTEPSVLPPGVYGLSNSVLREGWVKVEKGKSVLQVMRVGQALVCQVAVDGSASLSTLHCLLQGLLSTGALDGPALPWEKVFSLLHDNKQVEDALLPDTGVGLPRERAHSSIFMDSYKVAGGNFGTRSQTVIAVWRNGKAQLRERYLADHLTDSWDEVQHSFHIALPTAEEEAALAMEA